MSIDPDIAQNAQALRQLIDFVIKQGRGMMTRLAEQARQNLLQASGKTRDLAERQVLEQAAGLLPQHAADLAERYPTALHEGFLPALQDGKDDPAGPSTTLKFDELELMDERQVQESVDVARGMQMASMAVESELGELNALVSSALGHKQVQVQSNPIRTEVFVQALRSTLSETGVDSAVSQRWGQVMGALLGQELRQLYQAMRVQLKTQGVRPVSYGVLRAPQGGGSSPRGRAAPGAQQAPDPGGATSPSRPEATVLTVHQLHRLLAGEFEGEGGPRAGRSGAADSQAADSTFMAAAQMVGEVRQMMAKQDKREQQPVSPQDLETMRAPLHGDARAQGQLLGREVVNLIIANIAADKRLLPPVQQWVASLEPSLLRLALIDPRFFSNKQHPARLLLEEVVQHSFAFDSEQASGFAALLHRARLAVQAIDQSDISDGQAFAQALDQLRQAREQEEQERRQRQAAAQQALLRAEQRNQVATELARAIADRPEAILVPDEVMLFVVGPWAQVMAHARLSPRAPGVPDVDYAALVDDLFWSVRPELARNNLPRLVKLIPLLLGGLRQGLSQIDYPQDATEQFFDALIALHEKCLDVNNSGVSRARPSAAPALHSRPGSPAGADPSSPWLAPEEARDSGFMDDLGKPGGSDTPSDFAATEPLSLPMELMAEAAVAAPDLAGQLQVGARVELWSADRWVQVQLTWASPKGSLFLFTGIHGSTHSMTRRLLDRLCQDRQLRPISPASVVEVALDAVANVAMRNSVLMDIRPEPDA